MQKKNYESVYTGTVYSVYYTQVHCITRSDLWLYIEHYNEDDLFETAYQIV